MIRVEFPWGTLEEAQLQVILQAAVPRLGQEPLERIVDAVSQLAVDRLKSKFKVTPQISKPGQMPNIRRDDSPLKTRIGRRYWLRILAMGRVEYAVAFYNVIIPGLDAGGNNVPGTLERGGVRRYVQYGVKRNFRYRPRPYMAVLINELVTYWPQYVAWAKAKLGYS